MVLPTPRICCLYKAPFGEFYNNTAHSMGWYGFWIFSQSNAFSYNPHTGTADQGFCNGSPAQARIGSFTIWNSKRGFEIVNQTHMFHDFSAFEIMRSKGPYGTDGPGIFNSTIVASLGASRLIPAYEHHLRLFLLPFLFTP